MRCKQASTGVQWTIFFLISFPLIYGSPTSLFQGTAYSGAVHRHRNKNWCAFIVQKNVSCAVQGNVESFVEPGVAPCPVDQPDCAQHMMYRTQFRPTYKIAYKTVTELEWRCCPGYQGPDCKELKASPNRQTMLGPQPNPLPHQTRHTQRPERRETGAYNARRSGVDKARLLEEEMQRLSQTVQDLQATMTGIAENLRTDLQEDTSKMLVTLLNNMRPPDSARTGGAEESAHLDGHLATRGRTLGERGMEEVMARLDDVTDALKSKDEVLEELRGTVTGHDDHIRMLMDASQGPPVTGAGAPSDLDVLQNYIDGKFEKLRKDIVKGMEDEMVKLKSSYDDKIRSLQKTCEEGRDSGYVSLTKLVDNKEADLRKEIGKLRLDLAVSDGLVRTHRQTTPARRDEDQNDLRREVERVAEAHRVLNARMDNELEHLSMLQLEDVFGPRMDELEARMNVTERNSEVHCFYVEEKLTRSIAEETAALHQLLDEKLNGMEDQFTSMLVEMSNNSFPGMFSDSVDALQTEVNSNKFLIQGMVDKLNAIGEICSTGCKSNTSNPSNPSNLTNLGGLDSIVKDVRLSRNDLDVLHSDVNGNTDKISELEGIIDRLSLENQLASKNMQDLQNRFTPLRDNVSGLTGAVTGLGDSMSKFTQDLQRLNSTCCQAGQVGRGQRPSEIPQYPGQNGVGGGAEMEVEELRTRLDRLSTQVTTELSRCKESTAGVSEGVSAVDGRVSKLEKICGRLDGVSTNVQGLKEGLERHVAGLWDCVRQMNTTLRTHSGDISTLQGSMQNFQTQLSGIAKHILKDLTAKEQGVPVRQERPGPATDSRTPSRPRIQQIHIPLVIPHRTVPVTVRPSVRHPSTANQPSSPRQPYIPLQPTSPRQPSNPRQPPRPLQPDQPTLTLVPRRPVLETGEAGPPGYMRRVTVRRDQGFKDTGKPVQGFAGAPGYPPVNPVSFKPHAVPVAHVPWNPLSQIPVATPVASESSALADPFSFSVGLTNQPFSGDFGIIRFNRVLVNDEGHYNPQTGIFTVPMDGRYLVTAVLTAQRGEHVEAVLSVSNRSVQKLNTAGYQQGPAGPSWQGHDPCACGGSASVSLILSLRRGDRVGLVRTAGKLAASESREILSTFSGIFLYTPQAKR